MADPQKALREADLVVDEQVAAQIRDTIIANTRPDAQSLVLIVPVVIPVS